MSRNPWSAAGTMHVSSIIGIVFIVLAGVAIIGWIAWYGHRENKKIKVQVEESNRKDEESKQKRLVIIDEVEGWGFTEHRLVLKPTFTCDECGAWVPHFNAEQHANWHNERGGNSNG